MSQDDPSRYVPLEYTASVMESQEDTRGCLCLPQWDWGLKRTTLTVLWVDAIGFCLCVS